MTIVHIKSDTDRYSVFAGRADDIVRMWGFVFSSFVYPIFYVHGSCVFIVILLYRVESLPYLTNSYNLSSHFDHRLTSEAKMAANNIRFLYLYQNYRQKHMTETAVLLTNPKHAQLEVQDLSMPM